MNKKGLVEDWGDLIFTILIAFVAFFFVAFLTIGSAKNIVEASDEGYGDMVRSYSLIPFLNFRPGVAGSINKLILKKEKGEGIETVKDNLKSYLNDYCQDSPRCCLTIYRVGGTSSFAEVCTEDFPFISVRGGPITFSGVEQAKFFKVGEQEYNLQLLFYNE